MLYHASCYSGLKILRAKVSSHGKAYVYAVDNIVMALVFGVRKDDFDFIVLNDESGKPIMYECYPNAFEIKYKDEKCSVYELDNDGFMRGITGWTPELVCENDVAIRNELQIDDIYNRLLSEESKGNIVIHRYCNTLDYKKQISGHIVDRLIRFDAMKNMASDERLKKYYPKIVEALQFMMDGHLL